MMEDLLSQTNPLQVVGVVGALVYVTNYACLTTRRYDSDCPAFFVMNLAASSMVMLSLFGAFNAATLVIQTFFVGISLCGLFSRLRARRPRSRPKRDAARLRLVTDLDEAA